ncbi:MAG: acyl-CoA dehydratase activase [Alkaliphilus sp.]
MKNVSKSIGLCIGASSIGFCLIEKSNNSVKVIISKSIAHEGKPRRVIEELITKELVESVDKIAVTGKKLRNIMNVSNISELEALEYAYDFYEKNNNKADIIISAGGETFIAYKLDKTGKIINIYSGNKCASGTGEFFLQQIKRMDLDVEAAVEIAAGDSHYEVSGRCSVFCKSDCTHALNKGTPKGRVVAGLCEMMASKIVELTKNTELKKLLLIGGVSQNTIVTDFVKKKIPETIVPENAAVFEALGAGLWALENNTKVITDFSNLFCEEKSKFTFLPQLKEYENRVKFNKTNREKAKKGDECIIGLDVGSTTTKAVLIRKSDNAILASSYLRTNGDPIGASRKCYQELDEQVGVEIEIHELGITGSGRQIAGLHALTNSIINEITAHAKAAVYYDADVDTIFEIGGQDAKYTYITNGVPSDYAMNEACSAGTGSFLEEAAKESLSIDTKEIADYALLADKAPNFNDQCAAFIGSDIKNAIQEGIGIEGIAAGLVYSICMNYVNRVKGNRMVGNKIFMQGGVCYNSAVPMAMAALTEKEIIVPPEPGLMGAFGVALVVEERLKTGLIERKEFKLSELANREAIFGEKFICSGAKEKCDSKCSISRVIIEGKTYPFGGACNKYYNLRNDKIQTDTNKLNLVALRERLIYGKYSMDKFSELAAMAKENLAKHKQKLMKKKIAINTSLMTNTLYPLYYNFFTALGHDVIIADGVDKQGIERRGAAFCYPVEVSHGILSNLLKKDYDILFLPQIKSMPTEENGEKITICPLVQAEPYYLKTAFGEIADKTVISPVLEFRGDYSSVKNVFIDIGKQLGANKNMSNDAFTIAMQAQESFHAECKSIGEKLLRELEEEPSRIGVVLFGRAYNAFVKQVNMGIPNKFASRGYEVIPYDFLPNGQEKIVDNMYWVTGQSILRTATFVKEHPRLFGVFITNFSCGPDSFILGYFRDVMGKKPSLTLEIDSHTADAGIDTRIEAFIDVVKYYIESNENSRITKNSFVMSKTVYGNKELHVVDNKGNKHKLTDEKVHIVIPSMGDLSVRLIASALKYVGINATAAPVPTETELKLGQGVSSCKECLPLILTAGTLLNYLKTRENSDEMLVYFMPQASGPCRFGQYNIFMKNYITKMQIENVAVLSLTADNGYAGLGLEFLMRAWKSTIIGDVFEEIYSAVLVLAENKEEATNVYNEICREIESSIQNQKWREVKKVLQKSAEKLNFIKTKGNLEKTTKVALIGEIYVRRDNLSRQSIIEKFAKENIVIKTAPASEWIHYIDYLLMEKLLPETSTSTKIKAQIQGKIKRDLEKAIKGIFDKTEFYEMHMLDMPEIIKSASDLISPRLTGEAILTVGTAINDIVDSVAGVISIGPFGCMPNRIAEAILNKKIDSKKEELSPNDELVKEVLKKHPHLPFLSIETDGSPFPQLIESRIETFVLQAKRVQNTINNN